MPLPLLCAAEPHHLPLVRSRQQGCPLLILQGVLQVLHASVHIAPPEGEKHRRPTNLLFAVTG